MIIYGIHFYQDVVFFLLFIPPPPPASTTAHTLGSFKYSKAVDAEG